MSPTARRSNARSRSLERRAEIAVQTLVIQETISRPNAGARHGNTQPNRRRAESGHVPELVQPSESHALTVPSQSVTVFPSSA
jgi:hypothetical protein